MQELSLIGPFLRWVPRGGGSPVVPVVGGGLSAAGAAGAAGAAEAAEAPGQVEAAGASKAEALLPPATPSKPSPTASAGVRVEDVMETTTDEWVQPAVAAACNSALLAAAPAALEVCRHLGRRP